MNFPIALEAYAQIEESDELNIDFLLERQVVLNEIEANNFVKRHEKNLVVTKPLSADELGDSRINEFI